MIEALPRPRRVGTHLDPAERETLLALIARHPGATDRRIVRLFYARTDRAISPPTVRRARKRGYQGAGSRGFRLADSHRARLLAMIREAGPSSSRLAIARRFKAETGRPISWGLVARLVNGGGGC